MRLKLPRLPRRKRKTRFFAILPRRTRSGTWVWLEPVDRVKEYR